MDFEREARFVLDEQVLLARPEALKIVGRNKIYVTHASVRDLLDRERTGRNKEAINEMRAALDDHRIKLVVDLPEDTDSVFNWSEFSDAEGRRHIAYAAVAFIKKLGSRPVYYVSDDVHLGRELRRNGITVVPSGEFLRHLYLSASDPVSVIAARRRARLEFKWLIRSFFLGLAIALTTSFLSIKIDDIARLLYGYSNDFFVKFLEISSPPLIAFVGYVFYILREKKRLLGFKFQVQRLI